VPELRALERSCRAQSSALQAEESVWREAIEGCWLSGLSRGGFASWRAAALHLEDVELGQLATEGVKPVLRALAGLRMLPHLGASWATRESCELVRRVLCYRRDLDVRRRVVAFVCSADFAGVPPPQLPPSLQLPPPQSIIVPPPILAGDRHRPAIRMPGGTAVEDSSEDANLLCILKQFDLSSATNPEEALRALLLEFPFLPIDAGEGADRVIKAVAKLYLDSHPHHFVRIREDLGRRESWHNDAVSVVYILLYAVIMLNTDLHHPAIKQKMTMEEFLTSTKRTVVVEVLDDDDLRRMYRSISRAPLRICTPREQRKRGGLLNLNLPAHLLTRARTKSQAKKHVPNANEITSSSMEVHANASPLQRSGWQWVVVSVMSLVTLFLFVMAGVTRTLMASLGVGESILAALFARGPARDLGACAAGS